MLRRAPRRRPGASSRARRHPAERLAGCVVLQRNGDQVAAGAQVVLRPARRAPGRSAWNMSKSVLAPPTAGRSPGVNACTNGCMSVEDRSCFSYQVAAGSTMSDSRVVEVIRKSADTSRSSLPSGASSCQATSLGRGASGSSVASTLEWVPSRLRRKYSLPLAEEPNRLERHSVSVRGQFSGASTSSIAGCRSPRCQRVRDVRRGVGRLAVVDGGLASSARSSGLRRTAGRTASSPAAPTARWCRRCACPRGGLGQRRGERVGGVAVEAPLVGVHVPVRGADHGARRPRPVERVGQRDPAGDRPALLLADVVRPAAAVAAHAAGEDQQREDRPVGGVAVEPLADAGAHDDHRAALGLLGVAWRTRGRSGCTARPARW